MKNPLTKIPHRNRIRGFMPQRTSTNPFRSMTDLENEMDRWMNGSLWPDELESSDFSPAVNFKENNNNYVIEFDIPGIKKEDVKIELENNRLTVSGERSDKKEEKDSRHLLAETFYGSFMRTFNLPNAVDENKVDARYESGVLTVTIPKSAATKSKEIKVQ